MTFLAVVIAILPVVLILLWFYLSVDQNKKEKPLWLAISLLLGVGIAFLAYFLEGSIDAWIYESIGDSMRPLFVSFIQVSFVEEAVKWLPLFFIVRRFTEWDEYSDAVIHAVWIGMGFALVENLFYGLDGGVWVSVIRAFTAVPAHAVFAVLMGFFMARFHFEKRSRQTFLIVSFLLPFLFHGLYDFLIIQNYAEWLMLMALVVLIGCLFLSIHLVRQARVGDENLNLKS